MPGGQIVFKMLSILVLRYLGVAVLNYVKLGKDKYFDLSAVFADYIMIFYTVR